MKAIRRSGMTMFVATALAAVLVGGIALATSTAHARPPIGPLCGPSLLWVCSGPGGPDILFGGTVCEKNRFERKTGLTCVPYTG